VSARAGLIGVDTRFYSDEITSLSYFSKEPKRLTGEITLPPEIPPEIAESFRQHMREEAAKRQERKPTSGVVTSSGRVIKIPVDVP
jgi:hypothetical protein